jgi:hypothetical protein
LSILIALNVPTAHSRCLFARLMELDDGVRTV